MATYPNDAETRRSIAKLIDMARKDPNVGMALIFDAQKVINENKLAVDPDSDAYKEFALKLYHFKNTSLSGFFDDQSKQFGEPDFNIESRGSFYAAGGDMA